MGYVIYGLCCVVIFLVVLVCAMAAVHRQEISIERWRHARTELCRREAWGAVIDNQMSIKKQILLEKENDRLKALLEEGWGAGGEFTNYLQHELGFEPEQLNFATERTEGTEGNSGSVGSVPSVAKTPADRVACPEPRRGEDLS